MTRRINTTKTSTRRSPGSARKKPSGARFVLINRAPVLTLWTAVVAQRLGFDGDTALTLGKAVAGLNAQSKGRRLGVFKAPKIWKKAGLGEEFWIEICGRSVPAVKTKEGVRAVVKDKPIDPDKVRTYLKGKFGADLPSVYTAMRELAHDITPRELTATAFQLYEAFRPKIPKGRPGWGQPGTLDLELIRTLGES